MCSDRRPRLSAPCGKALVPEPLPPSGQGICEVIQFWFPSLLSTAIRNYGDVSEVWRRVGSRGLQSCRPGHRPGVNVTVFMKCSTKEGGEGVAVLVGRARPARRTNGLKGLFIP